MNRWQTGVVAVALAVAIMPAGAQVRWDNAQQVWFVTVHDDGGVAREMRVEPANRVVVRATLVQIDSGAHVLFRYRVTADSASPQALWLVNVPCDPPATILARSGPGATQDVWGATVHCTFEVDRGPGDGEALLTISSTRLAGLGVGVAVGARDIPVWPTSDPTGETDALTALVDSLNGNAPNGLAARFPIGVPTYDRTIVAQTDSGFAILRRELQAICGGTGWIDVPTCNQLGALLNSDVVALRKGVGQQAALTTGELRQRLNQFIQALVAGRNSTVHQNAFTILHVLARVVRAPLIPAN